MGKVYLSVIIPVKNGARTLDKCLLSIRSQTMQNIEIIILDSMSKDESREIGLKHQAKVIEIPDGTFNHGLTRNVGAKEASGDFLFYTVQDAWLAENNMLERMIKHFENAKVMGVVGHQAVPHEKDKNPMLWYKRFSEPEVQIRELADNEQFINFMQSVQQSLIAWDDVVAMYRKTALMRQPFVETEFAEDWIWSRDSLMKGWQLIYDPSLIVYHYHHADYSYAYKVAFAVNYHFYKYFNFKPGLPDFFIPMAKSIYHLCKHPELKLKEKIYWVNYNFLNKLGTFNSHLNYLLHDYIGGMKSVTKRYFKVCKTIPQGNQKRISG
ncbi:MAG: glycosyltransferase family 2 protein [Ferruginibacter sp.]